MAPKSVTADGMGLLSKKLDQLPRVIRAGIRRAVKQETEAVADDMRRSAPRDSGELIDSVQTEIGERGIGGKAVAKARHATFVEHGTEDTPAQPFAQPAAERSRKRFPDRIKQEVGTDLKGLVT